MSRQERALTVLLKSYPALTVPLLIAPTRSLLPVLMLILAMLTFTSLVNRFPAYAVLASGYRHLQRTMERFLVEASGAQPR